MSDRNGMPPHDPATGELIVPMRLQRFLARAGVASRRGSEDLMSAGRVSVNGVVVTELGSKVDPAHDEVRVDGRLITRNQQPAYLMLYKPDGFLTTMKDPQGRRCVSELVPTTRYPGLFPVGRLDKDTTGLLLFTTDGDLGQKLLHPSRHVVKTYVAAVDGRVHDHELEPLRHGIVLDDGPCKPARARVLDDDTPGLPDGFFRGERGTSLVEIKISEGRKHQVKRMLGSIHHPVLRLHRTSFGPLHLDGIEPGSWRELTSAEIAELKRAIDRSEGKISEPSRHHGEDRA